MPVQICTICVSMDSAVTTGEVLKQKGIKLMNTINEAEMADFVKNGAIKRFSIIQEENGRFGIEVELTWKEGTHNLVTTRGTPRLWSSLDTLTRHIAEKYDGQIDLLPICLNLVKQQT